MLLFFCFWCTSLQNGRGQEDAGGCFHDIFQVLSLGCEGGRGEGDGYIHLWLMMFKSDISFPCKPVSLSHHVCIPTDHPSSLDDVTQPFLYIYICVYIYRTPLIHQNWQRLDFYKSSKMSNKIHLGEICSKQTLPPQFSLELMRLVMNTIHFSKGFWQYVRLPRL